MGQMTNRYPAGNEQLEPLPETLTWSATLDPEDGTHEIEITDEMVRRAIAAIEGEQVFPFRAGTASAARPVRKAEVLPFPPRRRPAA